MKMSLAVTLLLTLLCSARADDSPMSLPLVGYNEHRTNLAGGRHANVSTNRPMVVGSSTVQSEAACGICL